MTITRADIAHSVGNAFIGGGAGRVDLIDIARAGRARDDVLGVLRALPARRYGRLTEIWDDMPDLPPVAQAA